MNVTMAVRLGDDLVFLEIHGNLGGVVRQSWNIFLFDDVEITLWKAKEIISSQQIDSSSISIIGCHNTEWHIKMRSILLSHKWQSSFLAGLSILNVVFQIAVIIFKSAHWQINLNSRVTKSLSQTSCDEDETSPVEFLDTQKLVVIKAFFTWLEENTLGYLRFVLVEWIDSLGRFFKKISASIQIRFQTAWSNLIQLHNLLAQSSDLCGLTTVVHAFMDKIDNVILVATHLKDIHRLIYLRIHSFLFFIKINFYWLGQQIVINKRYTSRFK